MNRFIRAIGNRIPKQLREVIKTRLEPLVEIECGLSAKWAASAHRRLMTVQWTLPPQPEFFDHHIDLFYLWLSSRNSLWLERGVVGSIVLRGRGSIGTLLR